MRGFAISRYRGRTLNGKGEIDTLGANFIRSKGRYFFTAVL